MEIVMSGIAKAFGTNQVLRDVSITLKEGEVHADGRKRGRQVYPHEYPHWYSQGRRWYHHHRRRKSAPSRTQERPS
mgnify:CR=1 FL=1